jgi:oligopeptide/dipeptide ABC transporter ATP-binding protein
VIPDLRTATTAGEPILEVEDLSVTFSTDQGQVRALRHVSLELRAGEIVGIVGESGSGKSTLLMSILRLLAANARIESGAIRYGSQDLLSLDPGAVRLLRGRELSLIPQRAMTALSPVTTIGKQLRRFYESVTDESVTDATILEDLRRVGLAIGSERLAGYPHEFSGGQLQRMLIASATLPGRPRVLLADEPTSTLDATVQSQVLRLLVDLRESLSLSIIFVTHDLGVVAEFCDRIAVMYAGQIVEQADVATIFHSPKHPYTEALLGTLPARHRRGDALTSIPGSVADSMSLTGGCRFAPRCQHVMEVCWRNDPPPVQIGQTITRCHLYTESHE